jgi:hypothetical protein
VWGSRERGAVATDGGDQAGREWGQQGDNAREALLLATQVCGYLLTCSKFIITQTSLIVLHFRNK